MTTTASPATITPRRPIPTDQLLAVLKPASSATFELISPMDGTPIATIPRFDEADVAQVIARVRAAQAVWAVRPMAERAAIIMRFGELLLDNQDKLLDIMQTESGKARVSAFEELTDASLTARYYAHTAARHLKSRRRQGALPVLTRTQERYVPKGVVGVISPWNYPLTLAVSDALPALLAGNGIILKPDSQTPLTALAAVQLLVAAGLPADLFGVVTGPGTQLGPAMIAGVDYLMFTGSSRTGRSIAAACGQRLIGFSAELGGKNPMIVLADADLNRVVEGFAWAAFSNSGQLCISIERLYVHDDLYDELVPRLVERTAAIPLCNGYDWETGMGSLVSAQQLETVSGHVADAVAKGATVLTGGRARPDLGPYFYEPTLLSGVTDEMVCARAETFGPVVSVYRVRDDDEAVLLANDSDYGLNASVWGRPAHAETIARRLLTGMVNVNEGYAAGWASHDSPMGGFGNSGMGRRHGAAGIVKYTEPQTIATQYLIPVGPIPQVTQRSWAALMTTGVRLLRRMPFFE